jgi:hypothetical protein
MSNATGELFVLIRTSFVKLRVCPKEGALSARLASNEQDASDPERDADHGRDVGDEDRPPPGGFHL